MKAYFTTLAARPMAISGRQFKFTISSLASGRAAGYFETSDPTEIAILDDAVRGRRGVREISLEELENLKKNRETQPLRNSNVSSPRVVRIPTLPDLPVEGRGSAASAASGASKPGESLFSGPAPTSPPPTKSLINVERVNPPKPFAQADQKARKASERADRAKVRVARAKE